MKPSNPSRFRWSHLAIHFLLKAYLLKPVSADPVFRWARIRDLAEIGILGQLWQTCPQTPPPVLVEMQGHAEPAVSRLW